MKKSKNYDFALSCKRFENSIRNLKFIYVNNRINYIEELERVFACCSLQGRFMSDNESSYIQQLYKKYIDSYRNYLNERVKYLNFSKHARENLGYL